MRVAVNGASSGLFREWRVWDLCCRTCTCEAPCRCCCRGGVGTVRSSRYHLSFTQNYDTHMQRYLNSSPPVYPSACSSRSLAVVSDQNPAQEDQSSVARNHPAPDRAQHLLQARWQIPHHHFEHHVQKLQRGSKTSVHRRVRHALNVQIHSAERRRRRKRVCKTLH